MCSTALTGGDCRAMSQIAESPRMHRPRRASVLVGAVASVAVVIGALFPGLAGPAAATSAAPGVAAVHAEPGDTTTTEPRDNRNLGNSITKPDQGADPVDAGDPGGWLQVSLFY